MMADEDYLGDYLCIEAKCRSGHRLALRCTRYRLRLLLETNTLKFYCSTCNLQFPPTDEEKKNLMEQLNDVVL